ncbi:3-hydroxyacyl-CoA dehydrogenase family protein [Sinanaerobacter chloroacetimidivorans]|uniref:3-hydroxybutyryl-CoA dehydrogenase n=1 Tax=Sinanaerobacter chloroacetimidivorans TaxID=2818044 RepID=A0A8J8B1T5_9FIRM|nr:3-hydroxyacyl-CoA dehydrogenase family protein [Sinanaerobacter chloroacetimidivorans]MBR0598072.1 3-hydroxyacyl-CoA dehydrogenase family protein [Sinanaerobacter chloroacetimidivorans]
MNIKKVAMVGGGTMGNQIAMQVAISGYEVTCYSRKAETVEKAEAFSKGWFEKSVAKGKMTEAETAGIQSRLTFTTDLAAAVKDVDLVIEAVVDVLEVKRAILKQIDALTPDHTIFASNSSYIVSSKFCDVVSHPENVLNLHFFNPALIMKLVEVVKGPHCSEETIETMLAFVESIGKVPALVNKEIYGFIVNRIFSAITKEACYMYDQGVASFEDIDKAVKFGLSHPMGPFELLDMTGIDLEYDVLTEKYRMTGDLSDKPSPAIVERYARGEYGRKSKKGFYQY